MTTYHLAELIPDALSRFRLWPLPANRDRDREQPDFRLPASVAALLAEHVVARHRHVDLVGAVFVDDDARPLAYTLPYLGYTGPVYFEPRRLLGPGVILDAAGLILFHNRSDGDLAPTADDLELTRRVRAVGEVMGIRLLDHLLLAAGGAWSSMRLDGQVDFPALGDDVIFPLLAAGKPRVDRRGEVRPKYVNPDRPAEVWSGRGRMARWLHEALAAGARLEDFLAEE